MAADAKVNGLVSYFPSIEKTYGKPVKHWLKLLDLVRDRKHMEQVAFLKTEHNEVTVTPTQLSRITVRSKRPNNSSKSNRFAV